MKSTIACLLILTLAIPVAARERTPEEQARRIRYGTKVSVVFVVFKDQTTVEGRLGRVMGTKLILDPVIAGSRGGTEMFFQDVSEIRSAGPKIKHKLVTSIQLGVLGLPILLFCGPGVIFGKGCDL